MNKTLVKHFIQEDEDFTKICMRQKTCNGCPYQKLCENIEESKSEDYKKKSQQRKSEIKEREYRNNNYR